MRIPREAEHSLLYGKPKAIQNETVSNAMGAKFANRTVIWAWPKASTTIVAHERGGNLAESFVFMGTLQELALAGRSNADRAAAAAKKL